MHHLPGPAARLCEVRTPQVATGSAGARPMGGCRGEAGFRVMFGVASADGTVAILLEQLTSQKPGPGDRGYREPTKLVW